MNTKLYSFFFFFFLFCSASSEASINRNQYSSPKDSCVEIVLKSGHSIIGTIVKSDSTILKYKDCTKGGEGIFSMDKNKVAIIKAIPKESAKDFSESPSQKIEKNRKILFTILGLLVMIQILSYLGIMLALIESSSLIFNISFISYILSSLSTIGIGAYLYTRKKFFGFYLILFTFIALPIIFFLLSRGG
jgi:hypothetical protein